MIDMKTNNSSVRRDFEVGYDAENYGGILVRLTFTFTASGMSAPLYVLISGLTAEDLWADACPNGILVSKVPGIFKGGGYIFNEGFGWLVFIRSDMRDKNDATPWLNIANKHFMHCKYDALLPFIR